MLPANFKLIFLNLLYIIYFLLDSNITHVLEDMDQPIDRIPGVGPVSAKRLANLGFITVCLQQFVNFLTYLLDLMRLWEHHSRLAK